MVPWADVGSRFTRDFEDQVAYLAQVTDQTTVSSTMRIAWKTVGQIIGRVVARLAPADRLEGLQHIGVDELSYRRHHEYVTVVVDHVGRKVVWASEAKSAETVDRFFAALEAPGVEPVRRQTKKPKHCADLHNVHAGLWVSGWGRSRAVGGG